MARSSRRRKHLRERDRAHAPVARHVTGMDWVPALKARWNAFAPQQRFLGTCGLSLVIGTLLLHGLGGVLYGQLTVFLFEGFEDLPGWVAVWGAASVWCLAAALATYLAKGLVPTLDALRWARWRLWAALAFAALAAISLLLWLLSTPGMWGSLATWPGAMPRSEWLLQPLPWAWPWVLPVASDFVQPWWLGIAVLGVAAGLWFFTAGKRPRAGLACLGVALLALGLWALGGAAYHYVAGRGLAGVVEEVAALNLQSHPGQRNADTFLWLLSAWFFLGWGALLMAGALHTPPTAPARSQQSLPR